MDNELPLDQIIQGCAEESRGLREEGSCYELFRRALVANDQRAWYALVQQYHKLLLAWIGPSEPDAEGIANWTWFCFGNTIRKYNAFARFANKVFLLAYLKKCAINVRRSERRYHWRRPPADPLDDSEPPDPEQSSAALDEALDNQRRIAKLEEWCQQNLTEIEQLVFYLSFQDYLKPQEIQHQHPDLFPEIKLVYRIKEKILRKLRGGLSE